MKIKYFLRGLGIGLITATILLFAVYSYKMSDTRIISRAKELGMVYAKNSQEQTGGDEEEKTSGDPDNDSEGAFNGNNESTSDKNGESTSDESRESTSDETGITPAAGQPESSYMQPADSGEEYTTPINVQPETHMVTITQGMTSLEVCQVLETTGIIDSASDFDHYLMMYGYGHTLQYGEHMLSYGMSYEELARALTK